jgi:hypothetical protein
MRIRCGVLSLLLGASVGACGSADDGARTRGNNGPDGGNGATTGSGGTGSGGASSGTGSVANNGGLNGGDGGSKTFVTGGANGAGGSGGNAAACAPAVAASGASLSFTDIVGPGSTEDISASCDGSFAAVGQPLKGISFTKEDATQISLPTSTVWVAHFDTNGFPTWAEGITTGEIDQGQYTYVDAFADGSVAVAGNFGKSALFDAGGPKETTLTGGTPSPEGYIARYGSDGTFQWAKQLGVNDYTIVSAVSAAPDGTAYAAVASARLGGTTIGAGEIDLKLDTNEGAIVALDTNGHFLKSAKYGATQFGQVRLAPLRDGGVLLYGESGAGLVLAKGTPKQATVTATSFYARLNADLSLDWVRSITDPISLHASTATAFDDGSVGFASPFSAGTLTLGKGGPHETTLTATTHGGFVVGRYGADGQLVWATNVGSNDALGGDALAMSVSALGDDLWVAGSYALDVSGSSDLLVAPGGTDGGKVHVDGVQATFFLRFGANGKLAWGVPMVGTKIPPAVRVSAAANSVVALGDFLGTVNVGGKSVSAVTNADSFVARFGP